jgi:hypothetical protein
MAFNSFPVSNFSLFFRRFHGTDEEWKEIIEIAQRKAAGESKSAEEDSCEDESEERKNLKRKGHLYGI